MARWQPGPWEGSSHVRFNKVCGGEEPCSSVWGKRASYPYLAAVGIYEQTRKVQ